MQINYYSGDIKPREDVIFVFGSNPLGVNGNPEKGTGGAALCAQLKFGVKQGEKMTNRISDSGKAYGLVTVKYPGGKRSLSQDELETNIKTLMETARSIPNKLFCVAYRNWETKSLNGYFGYEMAYLFYKIANQIGGFPNNLLLSKEWAEHFLTETTVSQLNPTVDFNKNTSIQLTIEF